MLVSSSQIPLVARSYMEREFMRNVVFDKTTHQKNKETKNGTNVSKNHRCNGW